MMTNFARHTELVKVFQMVIKVYGYKSASAGCLREQKKRKDNTTNSKNNKINYLALIG